MNDKTKAPTSSAKLAGAAGGKSGETVSILNFTTGKMGRQPGFVERFLSYGSENGLTLRDLVALIGWNERAVRKQIEQERRDGTLIISDNRNGYYLTDDPAEAQRFTRSMLHRSREIAQTARAIEKAAELL